MNGGLHLSEIAKGQSWSCRLGVLGDILTGIEEIEQQISLILRTPPGADPLRPEFACDVMSLIDQPFSEAKGEVIRRISAALETWMAGLIALEGVEIAPLEATSGWALAEIRFRIPTTAELHVLALPLLRSL